MDKDTAIALVVTLAIVLGLRYLPRMLSGAKYVKPAQLKQKLDAGEDVVVLDVRTADEFHGELGHIPGALHVALGDLDVKLRSLGGELAGLKDQPIFAVCRTENRSSSAARMLKAAGFSQIYVLEGGMTQWKRANLPTES